MEADSPSTILVVDDDAGLSRLMQKALQREGYATAAAASGRDAVDWLMRNRADLMLLDLKLQDIEGKELVNHLVATQCTVPFVIITGQGDERVAVDMMKRGALDYLVKDTSFLQFIPEVVRRALGQLAREKRLAEAEQALRRSETVLAHAEEIAHVGAYEINVGGAGDDHWSLETFRILGLDPAMKELTPGEYVSHCIHPEDRARVRDIFDKSLDQRVRFDLEYRIVRPDGSVRHVHHIVEPVAGAAKKMVKLIGTLQDITERKELEREILEISEREQRRIGQDLHDGLGQRLTAIEFMCESLRSDLALAQPESEKQAAQLCRYLRETIAQTRSLARGLAPFKVESGGLEGALTELAQTTSALSGVKCCVKCSSPEPLKNSEAAAHLYRIAQEAVNNAVKHGQPGEVIIHLSRRNGMVRLQVTDDGKGLPKTGTQGAGMGLHIMKHRAGTIGANLEVASKPGKGVTVTCTLEKKE
jgi:PAS domain S-box-containing protein